MVLPMKNKVFFILLGVTALVMVAAFLLDTKSDVTNEEQLSRTEVEESASMSATTTVSHDEAGAVGTGTITEATPVSSPSSVATTPAPRTSVPATPQSSSINLLDAESGTMVTVATARLAKPGFIAIYRTNSNERTELIGRSSLLSPGSYTNLLIQVDAPVAWKQVITAVIHADDGDGVFEFPVSDFYLKNGTSLVYDEDVVAVPIVEERGLINGTVEAHLEDARQSLLSEY